MSTEETTIKDVTKKVGWVPAEWLFRGIVIVGLSANLYMQLHYVTTDRYEKDWAAQKARDEKLDGAIVSMDKSLAVLVEQQKTQERQDAQIADHEARLRALESRR